MNASNLRTTGSPMRMWTTLSTLVLTFLVLGCSGQTLGPGAATGDAISDAGELDWMARDPLFSSLQARKHQMLNRAVVEQTLVTWGTPGHTAEPVPVGAVGPARYISQLRGITQNTKIFEVSRQAVDDGVNVILVIGDGMGNFQMSLPVLMNIAQGKDEETTFQRIMREGAGGFSLTHSFGQVVTMSGTAATSLSAGVKTYSQLIGIDSEGHPVESIADMASARGYRTGIITDTRLTHATPAAFYAHIVDRFRENEIAEQLSAVEHFNVVLGGGAAHLIPSGTSLKDFPSFAPLPDELNAASLREDEQDLLARILDDGYTLAVNREQLIALPADASKVFGLFNGSHIRYAIDRKRLDLGEPSLVDMTRKGLQLLSDQGDPYFLMIEAGRIDHAAHDNDFGTVIRAAYEMEQALGVAYEAYSKAPEQTLLIFTADHETGGLGLTYRGMDPPRQKTLASGLEWATSYDAVAFSNFTRHLEQTMSFADLFGQAGSAEEFYRLYSENFPFAMPREKAEQIWEME